MSRIIDQTNREGSATVLYSVSQGVQHEVAEWLNTCLGINQFDHMTQKDLQQVTKTKCDKSIADLRNKITSSVETHGSDIVAVVGYDGDGEAQPHRTFENMHMTMSSVASWQTDVRVIGLWVNESGQIDMLMHH